MASKSPSQQAKAEAKLKAQRQAFVDAYVECLNAAEAARRAGYSPRTAKQQGSRLLTFVDVRAEIDKGLEARQMGKGEVLARLADMASASLDDFLDSKGRIDLKKARRLGRMHVIRKYSVDDWGKKTLELNDPQAALVQLGRYHKLFVDRQEHTGKDGGPIEFHDVKARLLARFDQGDDGAGADSVPTESVG